MGPWLLTQGLQGLGLGLGIFKISDIHRSVWRLAGENPTNWGLRFLAHGFVQRVGEFQILKGSWDLVTTTLRFQIRHAYVQLGFRVRST